MHRGCRTQEAPCINVVRACLYGCVYSCTRIRSVLYRDAARHVSRRSRPAFSRQNDVQVIKLPFMHNAPISAGTSCALFLFLPLSVSLSLSRPLSRLIPLLTISVVLVDRQKTRFRSSGGDKAAEVLASAVAEILYQISSAESEQTIGAKKGGVEKCSDRSRRSRMCSIVKHVYACTRILRQISAESSNNFIEFSSPCHICDEWLRNLYGRVRC